VFEFPATNLVFNEKEKNEYNENMEKSDTCKDCVV